MGANISQVLLDESLNVITIDGRSTVIGDIEGLNFPWYERPDKPPTPPTQHTTHATSPAPAATPTPTPTPLAPQLTTQADSTPAKAKPSSTEPSKQKAKSAACVIL